MTLALLEQGAADAANVTDAEAAIRALMTPLHAGLGLRDGGPDREEGAQQFFVAGAFIVTPDAEWHMLVGNIGFPPDQTRLMIPIDAGHPGRVRTSRLPLHLPDTVAVAGQFKQYLKSARMGSAVYVPMLWQGQFLGQVVMAGLARNSMTRADFAVLRVAGTTAAAIWIAHGGPAWLDAEYPPDNAFRVDPEGM